jgi:hypothetical protein
MLTVLFWNLKRSRPDLVASLARAKQVDIILLAECPTLPAQMLTELNREAAEYFFVPVPSQKLSIYTKFSEEYFELRGESHNDFIIGSIRLLHRLDFLLCAVHFPSNLWRKPIDSTSYSIDFSRALSNVERSTGHARTVLVGDLNMNPFDDGMVMHNGLHAVPTRAIARRLRRTVKFESNVFFFNPMWQHLGEHAEGHAGTYYYSSPKSRADYWNTYDQVLIRPAMLPYFKDSDLQILHSDPTTGTSFLYEGVPDDENVADHLPIVCRFDI